LNRTPVDCIKISGACSNLNTCGRDCLSKLIAKQAFPGVTYIKDNPDFGPEYNNYKTILPERAILVAIGRLNSPG